MLTRRTAPIAAAALLLAPPLSQARPVDGTQRQIEQLTAALQDALRRIHALEQWHHGPAGGDA